MTYGEVAALVDAIERREDIANHRFATLMAVVANGHPNRRKNYTAKDFLPSKLKPQAPMSEEEMIRFARELVNAY